MDFTAVVTAIVTNGIGGACAAAILVLSWYRETKTLPEMMHTFAQTNKDSLNSFEERERRLITSHEGQNDKTLASYERRETKSLELFGSLVREERTVYQKWHEENRARLDMVMAEEKENRHLIKNLAHQLGLRKAVEEAEAKQREQ